LIDAKNSAINNAPLENKDYPAHGGGGLGRRIFSPKGNIDEGGHA